MIYALLLFVISVALAKGPVVTNTLVMTVGQGDVELGTIKIGKLLNSNQDFLEKQYQKLRRTFVLYAPEKKDSVMLDQSFIELSQTL